MTQTTSDPDSCIPVLEPTRPCEQCYKPFDYFGDRQASHVVLILDASGSMAGKVNGKSKMELAKRESTNFLKKLARDLPVGLMVCGHKGNNKDDRKQVSCGGVETLLPIGEARSDVAAKIGELQPTGWTPLAGALAQAEAELGNQPPVKEGTDSVPIVYLVSDGEETCDGDPVAAAQSLHASGVQAVVNVIGFDVDEKTRVQLEAISEAGGGRFFPAKDAKALNKHLNAAQRAEFSHRDLASCISRKETKAVRPTHRASIEFPACINRETEKEFSRILYKLIDGYTTPEDKACSLTDRIRVGKESSAMDKPLLARYNKMVDDQLAAREAARLWSLENLLPPKE